MVEAIASKVYDLMAIQTPQPTESAAEFDVKVFVHDDEY
jgi:hypothetical protein